MAIAPELQEALDRFGRPEAELPEARAEAERARILERFPAERWPTLELEQYALGTGADAVPYCQELEYRTPNLGSMKGGSSRKHIIYRQTDGRWWVAGPLEGLDPRDAWARLRAQFAHAIDAVRDGRPDEVDDLPLLRWGPALVTKTCAVYGAEHFLDVYSGDHLRRFIRLFGGTPVPEAASWGLNRQLLGLVQATAPFSSWRREEVLQFLYTHIDPRTGREPILKISPGERARLWPECRAAGVIRVGWDEIGDLRDFESDDALVASLEGAFRAMGPTPLRKLARQLLRFRDLPSGSRVVANRGTTEVLAVGTVGPEGYTYEAGLPEYRHQVQVEWDESYAQVLEAPARGWVPTFNNVSPAQWETIVAGRVGPPGGKGPVEPPPVRPEVPLPGEVGDVVRLLERKGQVVLHGPPGTGKTRLALSVALAMSGRASQIEGAARATALAEMLDGGDEALVRLATFHPSLGYEDFVEGYKPRPTSTGGLALHLVDGVFLRLCDAARAAPSSTFVLLVDEINRADLARVLGELVTVLERDKREHVTVVLPTSGRRFSVPANVVVLGTMNTADRSVAHLDAAVRRRFGFVEVPPDPARVEVLVGPLDLSGFLTELNRRLAEQLGPDHRLGHAHLMVDDAPVDSPRLVADAFYHEIAPQLEDSVAGDRALLRDLLGRELVGATGLLTVEPDELLVRLAKEFGAVEVAVVD